MISRFIGIRPLSPSVGAFARGARRCAGMAALTFFLGSTVACGYQLKQPRGEPNYPIEGVWASVEEEYNETGRGQLLYINSPGMDEYPYKFVLFQYYMRDLTVSGKRLYFTRRIGVVDTSDAEVILTQTNFQAGFRDNVDEKTEGEFWPAADFEPERLERNFGDGDDLDLLQFAANGAELVGDEYHMKRMLPAVEGAGGPTQIGELDVAVVLAASKDGREALSLTFSPAVHVVEGARDVWNVSGNAGRVKVHTLSGDFAQGTVVSGKVSRGDVLVLAGWKPQGTYKRKMSREEVLRRIQRGEPVPREELIRVLGEDAVKNQK